MSEFLDVFVDIFLDFFDLMKTKSKLDSKIRKSENPVIREQQCSCATSYLALEVHLSLF